MTAGVLVVDDDASYEGTAPEFFKKSMGFKMRVGQGIPGRVWASKAFEHDANVTLLDKTAYPRLDIAKQHNIRTTFAIFKDNRVYEFSTPRELKKCLFQTL